MNATKHTGAARSRLTALALATGFALSGVATASDSPTDRVLGDCVARAERYFDIRAVDFHVQDADTFRMGTGRQVLALDLALGNGINPRFYCIMETDGRISEVNTMPRLPGREAAQWAAK